MRKKVVLITGAVGEIGQALIENLSQTENDLLTLDLKPLPDRYKNSVTHIQGDIMDNALLSRLISEFEFESIFHLAALLSTRAEFSPQIAHRVNVDGTLNLLQMAAEQSEQRGESVRFIFPSSIAAYGLPDRETKAREALVREWEWNNPITMYGCNKLYCELLGNYFCGHYHQLAAHQPVRVDFRCLRFPGLISAFTVPSGGTSDFASEMLHAAAKGESYDCFVRKDTRIPFMAMPDAVRALLTLETASSKRLRRPVYNVTSFSRTAAEIHQLVLQIFPNAAIRFVTDFKRQKIVDSWPADLDDSAARQEWGWKPGLDADKAFRDYLAPNIHRRYQVLN